MADNAIEIVRLRNEFYRDNYRRLVMILLLSIVIIFLLGGSLIYIWTHPPSPRYFATATNGRIIPLVPLDEPNLSNAALLQWAQTAAIAAFTFDFTNYRQQLQAASEFFTAEGWESYVHSLIQTRNLELVKAKQLVVHAVATGAPTFTDTPGVVKGRYSWRVQMPLLVTYESVQVTVPQNVIVTMLITRTSTLNSPSGIGIAQFVAAPAENGQTF